MSACAFAGKNARNASKESDFISTSSRRWACLEDAPGVTTLGEQRAVLGTVDARRAGDFLRVGKRGDGKLAAIGRKGGGSQERCGDGVKQVPVEAPHQEESRTSVGTDAVLARVELGRLAEHRAAVTERRAVHGRIPARDGGLRVV